MSSLIRSTKSILASSQNIEEIAQWIDHLIISRRSQTLLKLLDESNTLYNGRGSKQSLRIKGYILAGFESAGLPKKALLFIFESLESGSNAYIVAAAAKAIRGWKGDPSFFTPFLIKGIHLIKNNDDAICFYSFLPPAGLAEYTTAIEEIAKTLAWIGASAKNSVEELKDITLDHFGELSPRAKEALWVAVRSIENAGPVINCCEELSSNGFYHLSRRFSNTKSIVLENQEGSTFSYAEAFVGKISIVCFFYSRCHNPNKCSLTISKMAAVQHLLKQNGVEEKVQTVAITYDPLFDLPSRLHSYAKSRGFIMNGSNQLFRCISGFETLKTYFGLSVNYNSSMVNSHAVELFIINKKGKVAGSYERVLWNIEEVVNKTMQLDQQNRSLDALKHGVYPVLKSFFSAIPPIVVAFFPKCPLCWASYLSLLGITGLQNLPYAPWLLPVFAGLAIFHLGNTLIRAIKRRFYLPVFFAAAGFLLVFGLGYFLQIKSALWAGIFLIFLGSLMNSLHPVYFTYFRKLKDKIAV